MSQAAVDDAGPAIDAALPDDVQTYLNAVAGSYEGALTYLDYGDDSTEVSLPTRAEYRPIPDGLAFDLEYGEPDGSVVTDAGTLTILSPTRVRLGDEEFEVESWQGDAQGFEMRLLGSGRDNDRPADFFQVVTYGPDGLLLRKTVSLESGAPAFDRNTLRLQRVPS